MKISRDQVVKRNGLPEALWHAVGLTGFIFSEQFCVTSCGSDGCEFRGIINITEMKLHRTSPVLIRYGLV